MGEKNGSSRCFVLDSSFADVNGFQAELDGEECDALLPSYAHDVTHRCLPRAQQSPNLLTSQVRVTVG